MKVENAGGSEMLTAYRTVWHCNPVDKSFTVRWSSFQKQSGTGSLRLSNP